MARMNRGTQARDAGTYRFARRNQAKLVRKSYFPVQTVAAVMNWDFPAPAWCSVPNPKGNRHQRRIPMKVQLDRMEEKLTKHSMGIQEAEPGFQYLAA